MDGAKNSVLPLLCASLLVGGGVELRGTPFALRDVRSLLAAFDYLNIEVEVGDGHVMLDASGMRWRTVPAEFTDTTRYSSLLLPILLRRFGRASLGLPGGCDLGAPRPLDMHLEGLNAFGVRIDRRRTAIDARVVRERSGEFRLRRPSVGATLALMLFSAVGCSHGRVLRNVAVEPEVQDVVAFLTACGARMTWTGDRELSIESVAGLNPVSWEIMGDRIEAGTFALAATMLGMDVTIAGVDPGHLGAVLSVVDEFGVRSTSDRSALMLTIHGAQCGTPLNAVNVSARPYPGFPTDLQPVLAAVCLCAAGCSRVNDEVFPSRIAHLRDFQRLGGHVAMTDGGYAVRGAVPLTGDNLYSRDIRGAAACVLAGFAARGRSLIHGRQGIERGYINFDAKLRALGLPVFEADVHQELGRLRRLTRKGDTRRESHRGV